MSQTAEMGPADTREFSARQRLLQLRFIHAGAPLDTALLRLVAKLRDGASARPLM